MPEAGYLPIPAKLAQAGVKDMVRMSDARMSGTAFGTIVLHVDARCRRRAARWPWSATATGSRLSVRERRIDLLVDDEELRRRRAACRRPPRLPQRGYARLYHDQVLQADAGCDFGFLKGAR